MALLTQKEREALLTLLKDYTSYYNAHSLSKLLSISHVGTQKMLKRFKKEHLVISKTIGKSIIYKLNITDDYVQSLLTFLLADEANNFKRWKEEFKSLFDRKRVVLMYGSAIKDYSRARDIDLMVITKKKDSKNTRKIVKEIQELLPKKIHLILLTEDDFLKNVQAAGKVMVSIIKTGIILYGQEKYLASVKNVAGFYR